MSDFIEDRVDFVPPQSPRECRDRLEVLRTDVKKIERQLADKNLTDKKGNRLSNTKYHARRKNMLRALHIKQLEIRFLKAWIRDYESAVKAKGVDVDPEQCEDLLKGAHNLLQSLKADGIEFKENELRLIDLIRDYIRGTIGVVVVSM